MRLVTVTVLPAVESPAGGVRWDEGFPVQDPGRTRSRGSDLLYPLSESPVRHGTDPPGVVTGAWGTTPGLGGRRRVLVLGIQYVTVPAAAHRRRPPQDSLQRVSYNRRFRVATGNK